MKKSEDLVSPAPVPLPSFKQVQEEVASRGQQDDQLSDEEDITLIGEIY